MIQESGATTLLEFKMSFSEETISHLVANYGKNIFDMVTVRIFILTKLFHFLDFLILQYHNSNYSFFFNTAGSRIIGI